MESTGIEASSCDNTSLWRHMDGAKAIPVVPPRDGMTYMDTEPRTLLQKADANWDIFFSEARRRPTDAAASLLQDLSSGGSGDSILQQSVGRGTPRGPSDFAPPLMPQAALDTW